MNRKQEITFKEFIIKYTVVASVVTWLISNNLKEFLDEIINSLIDPLFSIDIDENGEPDLIQIKRWINELFGFKFPIGKLILAIIKTILYLFLVYACVKFIFKYTDLLSIRN